MATKIGTGGGGAQARTPRGPAVSTEQSADLQKAGLTQGKTPTAAAKSLIAGLVARGFGAPGASLGQQLSAALTAFQQALGLPLTGRLDAATVKALRTLGVVAGALAGVGAGKSGYDGAAAEGNKGALTAQGRLDTGQKNLKTVLASLTAAAGGGSAAAQKALDAILNKGQGAGQNATASKSAADAGQPGVASAGGHATAGEASAHAPASAHASGMQSAGAHAATYVDGAGRLSAGLAGSDASGDAEANRSQQERESGGGEAEGEGGEGTGPNEDGAFDTGSAEGDALGDELSPGNAASGDTDDDDRRRGHARYDDGTFHTPGYYEVPPLSAQVRDALEAMARVADQQNRAAHYTWDAMFCRPGVYGAGQAAPEVLHLVVPEAEAFDRVWSDAVDALNQRLRRFEPGAPLLDVDEIRAALTRARYA